MDEQEGNEKMQKRLQNGIRDIEAEVYERRKTIRERIAEIVESRNLTSYMNDTKWKEFREAMENEMPFRPPYILKTLFEEEKGEYFSHFTDDVWYLGAYGAEEFAGLNYKIIEWVKVRPRYYEVKGGRLVQEKILHDAEAEFVAVLSKYHIPYEVKDGVYVIYGYR